MAAMSSVYMNLESRAVVAEDIARLVQEGHPAAEIAVLFRTNAQSEAFEAALAAVDVPYLVRGGDRFFARPEVRQGVLLLSGAARGDDEGRDPRGVRRRHRRALQVLVVAAAPAAVAGAHEGRVDRQPVRPEAFVCLGGARLLRNIGHLAKSTEAPSGSRCARIGQ